VSVVAALGGNALARRGEPLDPERQRRRVAVAADALAALARRQELVVTHGNGPQVGLLALQAESGAPGARAPLDVLGAETEGMIGYWIEQELGNRLPGRQLATLLTQVEVDARDPGFAAPSKPIGPVYDEAGGRRLAEERGWVLARDGAGLRRVVASPEPHAILELGAIELLVRAGVVVVCAGGGGIPVVREADGRVRGVEAVIDKDLCAELLARSLGAELLLLLTDVPAVFADWPGTREPVGLTTPSALRRIDVEPGSMGPKVEAACRFVERGGGRAAIGALEDAEGVLAGTAGTQLRAG
jgi:carbamate kinase